MKIKLQEITIRDVVEGYINDDENGCRGYSGKLNIRPPYQREFVYKEKQRNAVIETIKKNFPLNVMYWVKNEDGTFELLDGQQRTISICEYVKGNFSLSYQYFHNLEDEEKEQILNYKLMIYFCEGENREKLDWFKIINIAGAQLTEQELRNAIYTGPWLSDAKKYFSKTSCVVYNIGSQYLKGISIRQDYLEAAIKWISKDNIEDYMSKNQNEPNANELWTYFSSVITWIKLTFIKYRKEMKGIDFGFLYNKFKNEKTDGKEIEKEIEKLMLDDDVKNKKGIYHYILTKDEKYLSIRTFSDAQKRQIYEKQKGICLICKKKFDIEEMEADHIKPWCEGGKTDLENCQMLCKDDNRRKSNK